MSVKEPYDSGWKEKVRTRIRRSHGVIVLISKNSLTSDGQAWEIQCAKEEGKQIRGIWAYKDDRTVQPCQHAIELRAGGLRTPGMVDVNATGIDPRPRQRVDLMSGILIRARDSDVTEQHLSKTTLI